MIKRKPVPHPVSALTIRYLDSGHEDHSTMDVDQKASWHTPHFCTTHPLHEMTAGSSNGNARIFRMPFALELLNEVSITSPLELRRDSSSCRRAKHFSRRGTPVPINVGFDKGLDYFMDSRRKSTAPWLRRRWRKYEKPCREECHRDPLGGRCQRLSLYHRVASMLRRCLCALSTRATEW